MRTVGTPEYERIRKEVVDEMFKFIDDYVQEIRIRNTVSYTHDGLSIVHPKAYKLCSDLLSIKVVLFDRFIKERELSHIQWVEQKESE